MNLDYAYHHHLDRDVAQKTGFLIHHHQTLFLGICRECQKNKGGVKKCFFTPRH